MTRHHQRRFTRSMRNAGFTLVELMVSMVIGIFIVGALIAIVVTSTSAYNIQIDHARVNENARFSVEFLSRDVRMAGYFGCLDNLQNVTNNLNFAAGSLHDTANPIEGFEGNGGSSAWQPSGTSVDTLNILPGTDAITVRFGNPTESAALDGTSTPDTAIPAAGPDSAGNYDFSAGQVAVVSDCDKADVFQISGADGNNNLSHASGGEYSPGNTSGSLGGSLGAGYNPFATVMTYNAARYFVRKRDPDDTDANAPVALYRQYVTDTGSIRSEELIEGVENMQILYGEDTDADGTPNSYVTADAVVTWRNVVSAKIALLLRSNREYGGESEASGFDHSNADAAITYDLLGQTVTVRSEGADVPRFRRNLYSTTIAVRNR